MKNKFTWKEKVFFSPWAILTVAFIGIGLITWALGKVKTGLASLTLMSEPVTAAFLAWLILGEYLSAIQFCGGLIILFGIIYAQSSSELKQ